MYAWFKYPSIGPKGSILTTPSLYKYQLTHKQRSGDYICDYLYAANISKMLYL